MCKGNKKCKACALASIGKKMAKQRRSKHGGIQTVGAIGAGLLAGSLVVPKIVNAVDPEGKFDPRIISGLGAVGGYFLAGKMKGFTQTMAYGFAAGQALNLVASVAGLGYVDSPTYELNRVAGAGDNYTGTTGANPGAI